MNFQADQKLQVSTNQQILATAYSDYIKMEGDGSNAAGMHFDVRVKTAFTGTGSLVISLQDSADGTTFATRASSASFAAADLAASSATNPRTSIACPRGLKKYIRLAYTVTGTFTAGNVDAILNTER